MKKTLIIAQGGVARIFLDTIIDKYFSNDRYVVVTKDVSFLPNKLPSSFECHTLDYTSSFRISQILNDDIQAIFVVLESESECIATYDMLRSQSSARIVLSISSDKQTKAMQDDKNLVLLDRYIIMANKFVERLPNVPLTPRSFGLGQGEIMEIGIPSGSIFAYRHIGSIAQNKWRIVGVYRQGELILSSHSLVIQPNDNLLVIGNPKVLNEVYRQIKSDIGQFPAPFGRDIILYIDMSLSSEARIWQDIADSLFLNNSLKNNKLFIHIINPSHFSLLDKIRALESSLIEVRIDYKSANFREKLMLDSQRRFGLVIINKDIFNSRKHRKVLFDLSTPILKTGFEPIESCKDSFVVLSENMGNIESVASIVFDVSKQLKLSVSVYDYNTDASYHNDILRNYEELSRVFECKMQTIQSDATNPIFYMQDSKLPYMCFLPFQANIIGSKSFAFFSTDMYKIASMNNKHPQIFIPLPKK